MKAALIFIMFLCLTTINADLHGQDVNALFQRYVTGIHSSPGKAYPIPAEFLVKENADKVLTLASSYVGDTTSDVRSSMYTLIGKVGVRSDVLETRQHAVAVLSSSYSEKKFAHVGMVWTILSRFRRDDFQSASIDSLVKALRFQRPHRDKLLKLIGFLEIPSAKDLIIPLSFPPTNTRDRWAALLSLARMGDTLAIRSVMQRVQKLKPTDDVIHEIFPDLVYTRQPAAIEYMVTVLNSNEKNCLSPNPDSEVPIVCGYRIMEQLAPIIEGYPLKVGPSGDIETTDYAKALEDIRQWFKSRGTNYKIRKDTF